MKLSKRRDPATMSTSYQRAVVIIVLCVTALVFASFWPSPPTPPPPEKTLVSLDTAIKDQPLLFFQTLDINSASSQELQGIPGIGPVLAESITTYRLKHGLFRSLADLQKVSGIGGKTVERLRLYCHVAPMKM